jgi:hypothetical protein
VSSAVPAYLQPIFASLDTLLTTAQRDSLRVLPMDSAFRLRNWSLDTVMKPMMGAWVRTPIGDTVIARGEQSFVTDAVIIDLYQQHLKGERLDITAALRRISPEYVESLKRYDVRQGEVLLARDLDGSGSTDRVLRESRREAKGSLGYDSWDDETRPATHRIAMYLGESPPGSAAAWATEWNDDMEVRIDRTVALPGGGSLLVLVLSFGDEDETVVVLASGGVAREALSHQIDHGEGSFALRDSAGLTLVDATGDVHLPDGRVEPGIRCSDGVWPGSTLVFDQATRRFVRRGGTCISRAPNR